MLRGARVGLRDREEADVAVLRAELSNTWPDYAAARAVYATDESPRPGSISVTVPSRSAAVPLSAHPDVGDVGSPGSR